MKNFDKFYKEFEFAQTPDEKSQLLEEFTSENQISDEDLKELQMQIDDVVENSKIEEDITISMEIEDGKYQLYTCIKSIDCYKESVNYYVKVDDIRDFYLSTGIGDTSSIIQDMINSIKPIYHIVVDDGIGTLKRKNIFTKDLDFTEYFTKFV